MRLSEHGENVSNSSRRGSSYVVVDNAAEDAQGPSIGEVFEILRRQKVACFLPMLLLIIASVVLAWSLPPLYRSTATILIEQQEIPPELVRSTVSSFADERIQMTTQRVLTTANLRRIIEKYDLYPDLRKVKPIDYVVDRARAHFGVEQVSANRGRNRTTVAFNVFYEDRSPIVAQNVATELTSLYLEENLKTRTESASDTTRFLGGEAERLATEISELENQIAAFKETHRGRLPQQMDLNLNLMARVEQQIQEIERQIRSLEDRKVYLESSIAQLKASSQGQTNVLVEQLQSMQARLRGMLAVYTPDHPDVNRLETEIGALEKQVMNRADPKMLRGELDERRAELRQALDLNSSRSTKVKDLEREIANLEAALEAVQSSQHSPTTDILARPEYTDLQTQYRIADKEIAVLRSARSELRAKLEMLDERINEIPQIERQFSLLVRDRDNLMTKYQEIRAKLSGARVAENLEKARKGERFTLIEPARLPLEPTKPNRKKILALGLIGSVGAGLGAAMISEFLNKAVHGVRGVTVLLGAPPLAIIPYIESPGDRRRRVLKWMLYAFGVVVFLAGVAVFVHVSVIALQDIWPFLLAKLDGLWATLINRLEDIWQFLPA